jgi:adenylate kinase family enzyme
LSAGPPGGGPRTTADTKTLIYVNLAGRRATGGRRAAVRGRGGTIKMMPSDTTQLKRVVVIGTSGSGKTVFACDLAGRLKVRHVELDSVYWGPNWTPTPKEEFRSLASEAVAPGAWVLDGNYGSVRDILWARATTLIWLNYPFRVVAWRALSRTLRRIFYREVMWSGNVETFRQSFLSSDSVLLWVVKTYRRHRREYPLLFEEPAYRHLKIIVFGSPSEAERFLQSIG